MRHVVRLTTVAVCCVNRRWQSGFGADSILGTSTMTGSLLQSLQNDLKCENELRAKGIGETLQNYVHRAELSHMESPEADEKFLKGLDAKVDDLFARIPLPADPTKAALALTDEEVKEEAAAELVKEAVRELYWRKLDAKQAEELRLRRAQEKLQKQGADRYFCEKREDEQLRDHARAHPAPPPAGAGGSQALDADESGVSSSSSPDGASAAELRAELAAMRAKMAQLEELLQGKKE